MLEIQALTYNDLPPVMPLVGRIPKEGGTVGRGPGNAIILPDPMKAISRTHLDFIPHSGGAYQVTNISSGNPVFINNRELGPGQNRVIQHGDKIVLGGYVLEVRHSDKDEIAKPATNTGANLLLQPELESDFFAELMAEVASAASTPHPDDGSNPFALERRAAQDPLRAFGDQGIGTGLGLDTFVGKDDGLINGEKADAAELFRDPLADVAGAGLGSMDENCLDPLAFFGSGDAGGLSDILQTKQSEPFPLPLPPHNKTEDDLDRFFTGFGSGSSSDSDFVAPLDEPPAPPPVQAAPPPPPVQTAPPPKGKRTKADEAVSIAVGYLYAAFIEGLGIDALPNRSTLDPDFMRLVGQLLRRHVQGTVDLIAARAVIKQEVRANVTLIAPERNNPLKFSPDANVALLHMLGQRLPGFMEPLESVQQAFIDLYAHQIGVVSGMQSALGHVLDRFNPDVIGDEPQQKFLNRFFAVWRKAELWDAYGRYYHRARESAADHFQSFFGAAFLEAYEKAIAEQMNDGVKP
jgi:type VI secretion system FHA domain protein